MEQGTGFTSASQFFRGTGKLQEAHVVGATPEKTEVETAAAFEQAQGLAERAAILAGTVAEHDREMDGHNCVYTSCDLPTDGSLCGKFIHIKTMARETRRTASRLFAEPMARP